MGYETTLDRALRSATRITYKGYELGDLQPYDHPQGPLMRIDVSGQTGDDGDCFTVAVNQQIRIDGQGRAMIGTENGSEIDIELCFEVTIGMRPDDLVPEPDLAYEALKQQVCDRLAEHALAAAVDKNVGNEPCLVQDSFLLGGFLTMLRHPEGLAKHIGVSQASSIDDIVVWYVVVERTWYGKLAVDGQGYSVNFKADTEEPWKFCYERISQRGRSKNVMPFSFEDAKACVDDVSLELC